MPRLSLAFLLVVVVSASFSRFAEAAPPRKARLFSQTSIEKGWKRATLNRRPMLVMFTSDNCMYCKKMLAETYGHPGIERMLAANTQTVLAHADDYEGLVKKLGIRGYPSSVLISSKGDVLDFMEGYVPPKDFAKRVSPLLKEHARQARANRSPNETAER